MTDESIVENMVEIGGQTMSLAEMMNFDATSVDEVRRTKFPKGLYLFEISREAKLDVKENTKTNENRFVVNFPLICLGVVVDKSNGECAKMPGKSYFENFWIKNDDPEETIGQVKAFAKDVGYEGSAKMQDIIDGMKQIRFIGLITHNKNNDNPDDPYVNLQRDKIRPATPEEVAQYQTYTPPVDTPAAAE